MKIITIFVLLGLSLTAACTSQTTRAGITDAALTPLEDLNLKRDPIAPVLEEVESPYDVSPEIGCTEIGQQLTALNTVLGPDWDSPSSPTSESSLTKRVADETSEKFLDIIADEAGNIIPYRSWVRRLSGARAHESKVRQATERGRHRRTYLKALSRVKNCTSGPAPEHEIAQSRPDVIFQSDTPPQYREKEASEGTSSGRVKEEPLGDVDRRLSLSAKTLSPPTW